MQAPYHHRCHYERSVLQRRLFDRLAATPNCPSRRSAGSHRTKMLVVVFLATDILIMESAVILTLLAMYFRPDRRRWRVDSCADVLDIHRGTERSDSGGCATQSVAQLRAKPRWPTPTLDRFT
ncbi:hypothetical protein K437DRAFT_6640 [Tilletiaria anomala UBC 951]|uniref:Uncharacterized protein n=1 Tax=Tilletiaria anomala (strain ATCC 24038 / CBS 436.72 / UBC 951) TaxID=1037660 RepID=A0A066WFA9_TILAU|nr:uncharacterized protein K437DRAFT_6640 [Tilletiaria anomala UBC 951]KDN52456.1 hypothetical protein K437DRAFT_6640 [Tilletiaria anomala UBC 951]